MRILVVSNRYPPVAVGGYELMCAGIVEALRATGRHEVLVLTSTAGRRAAPRDAEVLRELVLLPENAAGALAAPLAAVGAARAAVAVLRSFAPELVYVWNGSQIPHAAIRVLADSGVPLAFSVQEHWFGRLFAGDQFLRYLVEAGRGPRAAWSLIARAVNRHSALRLDPLAPVPVAVTWCSEALRERTPPRTGVQPVLERTIHPATPRTAAFASLERRPQEPPTIAFVGRVEPQKGPHVAVTALADLRTRHGVDARLVLAGPCGRRTARALRRLAGGLGVAGRVELRGAIGEDALGLLLQIARALVVPSLWEEPYGVVCLEAACARVPVVAARSGGMPEILAEGEQALFFERGDAAGCADALAATLSGGVATERRVAAAFARAGELSFARYAEQSERFLEEALTALRGARVRQPAA